MPQISTTQLVHHHIKFNNGIFIEEADFYYGENGQIFLLTRIGNFAHFFSAAGNIKEFLKTIDKYYFSGKMESSWAYTHPKRMSQKDIKRVQELFVEFQKDLNS